MRFHAPTSSIVIEVNDLNDASRYAIHAIRHIRQSNDLKLEGYKHSGAMDSPQFAEQFVLDAVRAIGIELGAEAYGELDVSTDD